MPHLNCPDCQGTIAASQDRCPHCGRPGLFPNVRAATENAEFVALQARYKQAQDAAVLRGCSLVIHAFELEASLAHAVINRPLGDLLRMASSEKQGYATYYQLTESQVRFPDDDEWDFLRRIADAALFAGYEKHIRFAALSLNGVGVPHYGECSLELRDEMIGHRATLYEDNSTVFLRNNGVKFATTPGYRAAWDNRGILAVAKLADSIAATTSPTDFPNLLLSPGSTPDEDRFIEVNIFGPMSIRTFGRVILQKSGITNSALIGLVKEALEKAGVPMEIR